MEIGCRHTHLVQVFHAQKVFQFKTNLNLQVKPTRHLSYSNTNYMGFSNPECDLSVAYKKIFHMSLFAGLAWLFLLHTHDETFKEVIRRFVLLSSNPTLFAVPYQNS